MPTNGVVKSVGAEQLDYVSGQNVTAFFRSNDHPEGYRFVKVKELTNNFPVVGLSSGWLEGVVTDDFDKECFKEEVRGTYVHVWFNGTFRDPHKGHCQGLDAYVHPSLIRKSSGDAPAPLLSVLCVRWWDYWSNSRISDYDVTNDGMLSDLFDGPCGMHETIPGEYEVYTVFVRRSLDLARISGSSMRNMLRAPNMTSWMFLWPTKRTDADSKAGCVCEYEFFAMCQQLERAGIPTGWPHIAHVYKILCGKFWVPQMCLHPDYKVPATTRVHYAEFAEDSEGTAARAIDCLLELRQSVPGRRFENPDLKAEELRGVVKLGFSWMGDDVLPFSGVQSLIKVLKQLFEQPGSNQITCLVQEMVPDVVCEQRLLCFHDAFRGEFVKERIWCRMKAKGQVARQHRQFCDVPEFALTSAVFVSEDVALEEFFGGSKATMRKAEEDADALSEHWLCWFSTECPEPPQVTRMDFLVSRCQATGKTSVWTCELGECGASLCAVDVNARNAASLNSAMRNDESGRFPKALPPITRNDGYKS